MITTARKVTVTVTGVHISQGVRRSCSRCPVARALLEAVPDAGAVSVAWEGIAEGTVWTNHGGVFRILLPPEAVEFINAFDRGEPVAPVTFEAEVTAL